MKAIFLIPVLVSTLAAQDQAPALAQRFKAESPAINQLLTSFEGKQALAKAEAMMPANKLEFDKSSPAKGLASSTEFGALMNIYTLAGKAAVTAGDWEKAVGYFRKAKEIAEENHAGAASALAPVMDTWRKAETAGKAFLQEGAARKKELLEKATRSESEEVELKNFKTHEDNVQKGPMVVKQLQDMVDGLKEDASHFEGPIAGIEKSIKSEKEQIESPQFKGDKIKYVNAVMNPTNLETRATKTDKIGFVNRLLFLDPNNKKSLKQLDVLLGKAAPEPEKKAPAKSKSKKKKGN
ncbi:MAG: hypothetical protein IPP78_00645 [Holophagaceae bacterium]|nr:hypothetical protein [Holophagaceae bacterium]